MILLFLYRKSTVRWNTALRRFWPCAVLLFILLAVSAAGASARLALQDGEEILPLHPRQLEPFNYSYVDATEVTFRWTPTKGAPQYKLIIYREDDSEPVEIVTNGSTTSVTYDELEPGYTYQWRVDVNITTAGPHWDYYEFTLSDHPIVPAAVAEIDASDGSYNDRILVRWGHAFRATYYLLQRREQGSAQFDDITIVGELREHIEQWLTSEKHYEYRVLACNSAGCSAPSLIDTGWVGTCSILSPPELVSPFNGAEVVYTRQESYYYLRWEPVTGAGGYWIKVWNTETNEVVVDELRDDRDADSYEVWDEEGYMAWYLTTLHPVSGCPSSPPSEIWTYHAFPHPPPAVPVNVQASDGAYPDRVLITWEQPPSDADLESWQVWRATEPDVEAATEIAAWFAGDPEHLDEEVVPGTIYYYWIEACSHADGCSEKSAPDSGYAGEAQPIFDYSLYLSILGR